MDHVTRLFLFIALLAAFISGLSIPPVTTGSSWKNEGFLDNSTKTTNYFDVTKEASTVYTGDSADPKGIPSNSTDPTGYSTNSTEASTYPTEDVTSLLTGTEESADQSLDGPESKIYYQRPLFLYAKTVFVVGLTILAIILCIKGLIIDADFWREEEAIRAQRNAMKNRIDDSDMVYQETFRRIIRSIESGDPSFGIRRKVSSPEPNVIQRNTL